MDDITTLLKLIGRKSRVSMELGYFRALDYPRVQVDVGGGQIPAEVATSYRPEINEQVQVLFIDGKPWMIGPAIPKPGEGVVISVGSGEATLNTDIGTIKAPFLDGQTLGTGDVVKLLWASGPVIVGKLLTVVDAPAPIAPPVVSGQVPAQTFTANSGGAWQLIGGRWSSDEPRASNGYLGAWHYGTKIRDTIPATAHDPVMEIFIRYSSKFGDPPNFALHDQASRGGAPTLTNSTPWNVVNGWNRFPEPMATTYFNALKAGGSKLGIGLNHGGVNRFASTTAEPQSGALRISWRV